MKYYFGIFSMNLESRMKSLLTFSNTKNFTISENNTLTHTDKQGLLGSYVSHMQTTLLYEY